MYIKKTNLLHQSSFMKDYLKNADRMADFFDYHPNDKNAFAKRQQELLSRDFQRETLIEHLKEYNRTYLCSQETIENIDKLADRKSLTVVGGQQAGILTGPLYTIHKIISVLKLAKKQEELLHVPVIPVFWIAGEDHDFDEVNHIYNIRGTKIKKRTIKQNNDRKCAVSEIPVDYKVCEEFFLEVFSDFRETVHTKELLSQMKEFIKKSETYVDFFSYVIHSLFKYTGIVLVNSHAPEIRKLEVPFLKELVRQNEAVNRSFIKQSLLFEEVGYGIPIERSDGNANLFYHFNGMRLLLEKNGQVFRNKQYQVELTEQQILELIETHPYIFSNNVVTRPLMQEYLFPVLAFVAGPGEVAYWATLKKAFHLFQYKMPPIVPRMSFTIIEPAVQKAISEHAIELDDVICKGTDFMKETLFFEQEKKEIDAVLQEALATLKHIHAPLKEMAVERDKGLEKLAEKNLQILQDEVLFLGRKVEQSVRKRYEKMFSQYDLIGSSISPLGRPQERCLNILAFLNEYGFDFVQRLLEFDYSGDEQHLYVYI